MALDNGRLGWICPKCNVSLSPDIQQCHCSTGLGYPYVPMPIVPFDPFNPFSPVSPSIVPQINPTLGTPFNPNPILQWHSGCFGGVCATGSDEYYNGIGYSNSDPEVSKLADFITAHPGLHAPIIDESVRTIEINSKGPSAI